MKKILFGATVLVAAIALPFAASHARCTGSAPNVIKTALVVENGQVMKTPLPVSLLRFPDGTAEYVVGPDNCTALAFTGMNDGNQVYTADGHNYGRSQDTMVLISADNSLTVVHIAGLVQTDKKE